MVKLEYVPDAGDLVWIDFNPQKGHEQAGHRPALVLSSRTYNRIGLAVVCPISNQAKGYPFEVPLPAGPSIRGVILADHVRNLDWRERRATKAGSVPRRTLEQVQSHLALLLGMNLSN